MNKTMEPGRGTGCQGRSGAGPAWWRWGWVAAAGLGLGVVVIAGANGQNAQPASVGMPVGTLVAFAGAKGVVPESEGWMLCDGRELSSVAFPALHAVLGRAWGGAENGATFRLPDLRGRFVRGVNYDGEGAMRDPDRLVRVASAEGGNTGNEVGTLQEDVAGPHTHPLFGAADAVGQGVGGGVLRFHATKIPDATAPAVRNDGAVQPGEGAETRPRNVAVNWIIRVR